MGTFVVHPVVVNSENEDLERRGHLLKATKPSLDPSFSYFKLVVPTGPSPFKNGMPKTKKSSSPWSPVTVLGFTPDKFGLCWS